MGVQKGLEQIQKYKDEIKRRKEAAELGKIPWLGMEDGETIKVWYLQELDEGAKNYSEKNGWDFATEHSSPQDFRKREYVLTKTKRNAVVAKSIRKTGSWDGRPRVVYISTF